MGRTYEKRGNRCSAAVRKRLRAKILAYFTTRIRSVYYPCYKRWLRSL